MSLGKVWLSLRLLSRTHTVTQKFLWVFPVPTRGFSVNSSLTAVVSTHMTLFLYSTKKASEHLLLSYLTMLSHLSWLCSSQLQAPRSLRTSVGITGPG